MIVFAVFDKEQVDDLEKTPCLCSIILEDQTAIVVSLPNPDKSPSQMLQTIEEANPG